MVSHPLSLSKPRWTSVLRLASGRISVAVCFAAVVIAGTETCTASDWANALFESRNHDFGSVARAAKTEHVFEFVNISDAPLHVSSVRASCGCTKPVIVDETVQPGETGRIRAEFNTHSFLGQRGATITVVFDRPRYGEAQLRVDGYVRRDVVCDPGEIELGAVKLGASTEANVEIQYAGRNDWAILDTTTNVPGLRVEVNEISRSNGRVGYRLTAIFTPGTTGFVNGEIQLETNDGNHKRVPIVVSGNVVEAVNVSPNPLSFGVVAPGESSIKKVVVKGDRPFRILSANCSDLRVRVDLTDEAKPLQLLPVTFHADETVGSVEFVIELQTDDEEIGLITVSGVAPA